MELFLDELTAYEAYYIMECFAVLTYAWTYPKRDRFATRMIVLLALGIVWHVLIALFSAYTMDTINRALGNMLKYLLSFVYMVVILLAAFRMRLPDMLFFAVYGLVMLNLASILYEILIRAVPVISSYSVLITYLINLGLFFVIYIVNYFAAGKYLKAVKELDIDIINVVILLIAYTAGSSFIMFLIVMMEDSIVLEYLLFIVDFIYCIILFVIDYWILWRAKRRTKKKVDENLFQMEQMQFESLKRSMDAVNARYHDLKYYVDMFEKSGSAPGDISDLKQAVADYGSQLNTGNRVLDIVLSDRSRVCAENGIAFSCMVQTEKMPEMSDADIYSLFGNALDNAIEYLCKVEDKDRRILNVRIRCKNVNFLFCDISNWCAEPPEISAAGTISTSKTDGGLHGIGISNMRRIVNKYGGSLEIKYEDNFFHLYLTFLIAQPAKKASGSDVPGSEGAG